MQIYTQLPEKGYKFKRKNLARYKNFNYNRKVTRGNEVSLFFKEYK